MSDDCLAFAQLHNLATSDLALLVFLAVTDCNILELLFSSLYLPSGNSNTTPYLHPNSTNKHLQSWLEAAQL